MLRVFTHALRELSLNEELAVTDLLQVHEQSDLKVVATLIQGCAGRGWHDHR